VLSGLSSSAEEMKSGDFAEESVLSTVNEKKHQLPESG
jgi:hypothetical protein